MHARVPGRQRQWRARLMHRSPALRPISVSVLASVCSASAGDSRAGLGFKFRFRPRCLWRRRRRPRQIGHIA
eukprot:356351-Chlamydomonas_euryale.AAC.3